MSDRAWPIQKFPCLVVFTLTVSTVEPSVVMALRPSIDDIGQCLQADSWSSEGFNAYNLGCKRCANLKPSARYGFHIVASRQESVWGMGVGAAPRYISFELGST